MDSQQFDELTRALATGVSRRQVLKGFIGAALGSLFGMFKGQSFDNSVPAFAASTSSTSNPCQCYLNNTCPPPTQQSCIIQPYDTTGTNFIGKPIKDDIQFFGALDQINTCAVQNNVFVDIVSSFRSCKHQAQVNPKVKISNHLAGHAIDMNVKWFDANGNPHLCSWNIKHHTGCLAQPFNKYPVPVQNFINCVKSMGLRWGGDFVSTGFDPVHFDDGLNLNFTAWLARFNLAQTSNFPCLNGEICTNGICGCPTGLTLCNGICTNTQSDPSNCGACGVSCLPGNKCCNGTCIDTQTDPNNCGMCGTVCPSGQDCCQGACANTQTDPNNCGSCGTVCPSGQSCCQGVCTDTQTDPKNCGTCGTVCPSDATCVDGTCTCPTGLTLCNGMCVNTQSDPSNCGACGVVCPAGTKCDNGMCLCPDGQPPCNGVCCPAGQTCTNGVCTCSDGRPACNGVCCPPELTCVNGVCACPDGRPPCNNVCCTSGASCCGGVCCTDICCNGVCCSPGATCCNGVCCNHKCCNGSCCSSNLPCCHLDGTCCAPGGKCCPGGGCCDTASGTCCPDVGCCEGAFPVCCPNNFCCSPDFPFCCPSNASNNECCSLPVCCGTFCCPDGTFCCSGGCCTAQGVTLVGVAQPSHSAAKGSVKL